MRMLAIISVRLERRGRLPKCIGRRLQWSVGEEIPGHERQLDGDKRDADGQEIPAPDVAHEVAVLEEADREDGRGDARVARRSAPVRKKTLVHQAVQDAHDLDSSVKRSSVEQRNTRAKASASGRLGT